VVAAARDFPVYPDQPLARAAAAVGVRMAAYSPAAAVAVWVFLGKGVTEQLASQCLHSTVAVAAEGPVALLVQMVTPALPLDRPAVLTAAGEVVALSAALVAVTSYIELAALVGVEQFASSGPVIRARSRQPVWVFRNALLYQDL
jgi:hypothetical protein